MKVWTHHPLCEILRTLMTYNFSVTKRNIMGHIFYSWVEAQMLDFSLLARVLVEDEKSRLKFTVEKVNISLIVNKSRWAIIPIVVAWLVAWIIMPCPQSVWEFIRDFVTVIPMKFTRWIDFWLLLAHIQVDSTLCRIGRHGHFILQCYYACRLFIVIVMYDVWAGGLLCWGGGDWLLLVKV